MQALDDYPELQQNTGILDEKYKIIDTIGEGRYAKVKLGIDISNNKKVAIKIMKSSQENLTESQIDSFVNEVKIIASIHHQNIIKLYKVSINGQYKKPDGRHYNVMYYVMKIAEYRELFNFIEETPNFPEKIARYYFRQLIDGIEAMHTRQIGHRDIKPENILIDKNYNIKICDFGFACFSTDSQNNRKAFDSDKLVGSPEYNPPEISNYSVHYNSQYFADEIDIFACGLVLFLMVMKNAPFQTTHKHDPYYQRLCRKDKNPFWKIFSSICKPSEQFKDLIEKMLAENPDNRLTLEEIKNHPWYLDEVAGIQEVQQDMKNRTTKILELWKQKFEKKINKKQKKQQDFKKNQYQISDCQQNTEIKQKFQQIIQEINDDIENMRNRRKALKKNTSQQQVQKLKKQQQEEQYKMLAQGQYQSQEIQQMCQNQQKDTIQSHKQNYNVKSDNQEQQFKQQNKEQQQQAHAMTNQLEQKQQQSKKKEQEKKNQKPFLNEENLKRQQEMYKKLQYQAQYKNQAISKSSSGSEKSWEGKKQNKKQKAILKKQSQQQLKKYSGQNTGSFSSSSSQHNQEEFENDKKEEKKNQDSTGYLGERKDQL